MTVDIDPRMRTADVVSRILLHREIIDRDQLYLFGREWMSGSTLADKIAKEIATALHPPGPTSRCTCGTSPDPGVCAGCPFLPHSHCVCAHPEETP